MYFAPPLTGFLLELGIGSTDRKTRMMELPECPKSLDRFSRLAAITAGDGQQDIHLSTAKTALAERHEGKN